MTQCLSHNVKHIRSGDETTRHATRIATQIFAGFQSIWVRVMLTILAQTAENFKFIKYYILLDGLHDACSMIALYSSITILHYIWNIPFVVVSKANNSESRGGTR